MIRFLMILSAILLVGGGTLTRFLDSALTATTKNTAAQSAMARAETPRGPVHSGRSMTLETSRNGHFETEARIGGRDLKFLVDTGASVVALRESDAARIGIRPARGDYTTSVSTANGTAKAAPARLDRVEIGGITVYDVRALVMPDEVLGRNLLGMSFLSQLKRYEVADGRMVLEQ